MTKKLSILAIFTMVVAALTAIAARSAQQPPVPAATLVLTNGKVITIDPSAPEAQAVAIRGDRIVAAGSSAEIKRYIGQGTEVIDLKGQLAIPGFVESHGHFTGVGEAQLNLNLISLSDRKACTSASVPAANCVAHKASPAGR